MNPLEKSSTRASGPYVHALRQMMRPDDFIAKSTISRVVHESKSNHGAVLIFADGFFEPPSQRHKPSRGLICSTESISARGFTKLLLPMRGLRIQIAQNRPPQVINLKEQTVLDLLTQLS